MRDLPFTCGHPDEQLPVIVNTDCGGRQHLTKTVWNELWSPVPPDGYSRIGCPKIDPDHHFSLMGGYFRAARIPHPWSRSRNARQWATEHRWDVGRIGKFVMFLSSVILSRSLTFTQVPGVVHYGAHGTSASAVPSGVI